MIGSYYFEAGAAWNCPTCANLAACRVSAGDLRLKGAGPLNCVVLTVPVKAVNTTVGGNITLLCTYTTQTDSSNLFIQWSFYSAQEKKLNTGCKAQSGNQQQMEVGKDMEEQPFVTA
ncbi:UNVERIFIED_CONTAM: hypothetical protein K2H54_047108 [Gekko kuhli]